MAMSVAYLNEIATHGGSKVTHIGLVDELGTELSGAPYARKAVTWGAPNNGTIRPTQDLVFDIPANKKVGGWRGFSAATSGTNYGGKDLTVEEFAAQGEYKLLKDSTGIKHESGD